MKKIYYLIFILLFACNSNKKDTELNLPKTTSYITINEPNYSFQYPNSWERKKMPAYVGDKIIDIQSHAYANLQYIFMVIPDSLVTQTRYNLENPLKDDHFISSTIFIKNNKKYYKTETLTHGIPSICINITCLDNNRQSSINFTYSEKATPKDKIAEGLKSLETFVVK